MGIPNAAFRTGDLYIEYAFEDVLFRYEKESGRFFRKFYDSSREQEIPHDSKLLTEATCSGVLTTAERYTAGGAPEPIANPTADSLSRVAVKHQRTRPYWLTVTHQDSYTRSGDIEVGEDGRLELLVTLPLQRWQVVTVKAIALSFALFAILVIVSLVSAVVFIAIESQVDSETTVTKMITGVIATWPLTFAFAMISMFLAAFCSRRRIAALIATALVIISYFGSNLASMVSAIEPLKPFFLHTYLDATGNSVIEGQDLGDVFVLISVGLVSFALTLLFFQRRNITVGMWPWQSAKEGT